MRGFLLYGIMYYLYTMSLRADTKKHLAYAAYKKVCGLAAEHRKALAAYSAAQVEAYPHTRREEGLPTALAASAVGNAVPMSYEEWVRALDASAGIPIDEECEALDVRGEAF